MPLYRIQFCGSGFAVPDDPNGRQVVEGFLAVVYQNSVSEDEVRHLIRSNLLNDPRVQHLIRESRIVHGGSDTWKIECVDVRRFPFWRSLFGKPASQFSFLWSPAESENRPHQPVQRTGAGARR